jgi:hypothetical protein
LAETLKTILARVPTPAARNLRWERRVSLAVVLARAKRADLAREQLQRCADSVDESSARSLTTAELYNFLGLTGAYAIDMPAPLRRQMLDLLPPTLRERLERPR